LISFKASQNIAQTKQPAAALSRSAWPKTSRSPWRLRRSQIVQEDIDKNTNWAMMEPEPATISQARDGVKAYGLSEIGISKEGRDESRMIRGRWLVRSEKS
jgi:hypothetical protein